MTPPVVLVHGWGGSFAATFASGGWLRDLEVAGRTIVALDLPGHGRAPASHDPRAYADLATGLVDRLPDGPLDAVGFSLGGKLLLEIALRGTRRFRRLVIGGVGDNIFAPERSGELVAEALERGLSSDAPLAVVALVEYSRASGGHPMALAAVLRRPPNPQITAERLRRFAGEIMVINGGLDRIASPDDAFIAALPAAALVRLPDVDHVSLPGNAAFRRAALAFLNDGR